MSGRGTRSGAAEFARRAAALPKDQDWDDPYAEEYLRRQVVQTGRFAEPERLEAAGRLQEALPLFLDLAKDAGDSVPQIAAGTVLYKLKRVRGGGVVLPRGGRAGRGTGGSELFPCPCPVRAGRTV